MRYVDQDTNRYESKIYTADGELIRSIEGIPSQPAWGGDDDTLVFINVREPVSNLWAWPLDGFEPYPLTEFDDPDINVCGFRWSRDGEQLAVVRCRRERNAVTITNFR